MRTDQADKLTCLSSMGADHMTIPDVGRGLEAYYKSSGISSMGLLLMYRIHNEKALCVVRVSETRS